MDEEVPVSRTAVIKEVTTQHLESTYTCVAKNHFGNVSVTIRLKKKNKGNIFKSLLHNSCVNYAADLDINGKT